jgi:hypothetical protein
MTYYFTPPTVDEGPAGDNRLFWRYKLTRADTVIGYDDGSYDHFRTPGLEQLEAARVFYQGGHKTIIKDEAERLNLIANGYAAYITED